MIIIGNNEELCRFVPNVAVTVSGESTLYGKIYPWLEVVETDLLEDVIGSVSLSDNAHRKILLLAQFVEANTALAMAVPSLDLVLTPNGFGVVNTTNLAPASKERVERLIAKCHETASRSIDLLISALADVPEWLTSKQGKFFYSTTLTYPYQTAKACNIDIAETMTAYKRLVAAASVIEAEYAEKWISDAVMARLRAALIDNSAAHMAEKNLGYMVRSLVIRELNGEHRDCNALRYLVNQIRNSPAFPEWAESDTAKAYNVEPYKNDKRKGGYWI